MSYECPQIKILPFGNSRNMPPLHLQHQPQPLLLYKICNFLVLNILLLNITIIFTSATTSVTPTKSIIQSHCLHMQQWVLLALASPPNIPSVTDTSMSSSIPINVDKADEDGSVSKMSDAETRISHLEMHFSRFTSSFNNTISDLKRQSKFQEENQSKQEKTLTTILELLQN